MQTRAGARSPWRALGAALLLLIPVHVAAGTADSAKTYLACVFELRGNEATGPQPLTAMIERTLDHCEPALDSYRAALAADSVPADDASELTARLRASARASIEAHLFRSVVGAAREAKPAP